jgi:glycosyltransferase involved in cell wall biosynthesis
MLSIIIPCYNELENLPTLIERFSEIISEHNAELIIVDNGSTDKSCNYLESQRSRYPFLKILRIEENKGYGDGIMQGLKAGSGDVLCWSHADLQTDPEDIFKGYTKFKSFNIKDLFLKGQRAKRTFIDGLFSSLMQSAVFLILDKYLKDINAQPKMFSKEFYKEIKDNAPDDFTLDLYFYYMALKKNYKVTTIPVTFHQRIYGEAKGGGSLKAKLSLSFRTLKYILQFRKQLKC